MRLQVDGARRTVCPPYIIRYLFVVLQTTNIMKFFKIYLIMTLLLAISPLRMSSAPPKSPTTYVEILYFHGKVRCQTCNDIEASASKVVRASFAKELKSRQVVFRVVDFSQSKNKALARKYQVSWSSLILVRHHAGKEKTVNLTNYAFSHIANKQAFQKELERQIRMLMK